MTMNNYIKGLVLSVGLVFLCTVVRSQDKEIPKELYSAAGIPDSLKEDANAVLRYRTEDYNVKGPGKVVKKVHTIVTILDEKGNYHTHVVLPYNKKFGAVSSFEMVIYDAAGKVLKKYRKSDMYEHAAESEESIVTDDRVMEIAHAIASYPTTVEMIYELDENSLINLGTWLIQAPEESVQNSQCRVEINSGAGFRYLDRNTNVKPQQTANGDKSVYTWQVSNLKAYKLEDGAKSWRVIPAVRFLQNKFEYYGVPGDITTWQNYGKWQQALNSDVSSLSPQRIVEIRKMTDTIKTEKDKAKFLYKYMQQNMRYVSIQLGIGGLKPFPSTFVDEKKYGDCKALSNYMRALLKAVDINSYYTMIRSGANEEPASYSFPYDNFDHVILCIPFKNDTTWMECTSNKTEFGKLGSFTENRNALLITENGGTLVNTPKSKATDNQFNSNVHIQLLPDGGAKTQVKISSTGEYRELYLAVEGAKYDEQKQFWMEDLDIKQPSSFNFDPGKDVNDIKQVELTLEYDQFCDVKAGDKQFYRPSAFKLWGNTLPAIEKRKSDYYWKYPRIKSCTTTIDLPAGYEVETLPVNASLKFTYGNYDVNYVYNKDKNQVVSTAKFVLNNQVIPASKYNEMQEYLDAVAKAQNKKLVIHKKA